VAISPDVVSFVHCRFGYCDLLRRSGIRNVAGETSFVSLATGTARNAVYCTPSRKAEALPPVPLAGGFIGAMLFSCVEFAKKETTFMSNSEAARHRAEANFKKKELQVREGAKAVADYEATGRAVEKKTARLKALRLAKEEERRQAEGAKKSGPPH